MKASSLFLFSALVAAVSCEDHPQNPWKTCPPSSKLKCYIHGTKKGDNLGPPMSDVTVLRDYWAKQGKDLAKSDGGKDADPTKDDPDNWGSHGSHGLNIKANAYKDGCSAYHADKEHNKDAVVKVCQPHKNGNPSAEHYIKDVCVSIYMDDIINGCKGKADDDSKLNGQVWVEHWGATLRITNE